MPTNMTANLAESSIERQSDYNPSQNQSHFFTIRNSKNSSNMIRGVQTPSLGTMRVDSRVQASG